MMDGFVSTAPHSSIQFVEDDPQGVYLYKSGLELQMVKHSGVPALDDTYLGFFRPGYNERVDNNIRSLTENYTVGNQYYRAWVQFVRACARSEGTLVMLPGADKLEKSVSLVCLRGDEMKIVLVDAPPLSFDRFVKLVVAMPHDALPILKTVNPCGIVLPSAFVSHLLQKGEGYGTDLLKRNLDPYKWRLESKTSNGQCMNAQLLDDNTLVLFGKRCPSETITQFVLNTSRIDLDVLAGIFFPLEDNASTRAWVKQGNNVFGDCTVAPPVNADKGFNYPDFYRKSIGPRIKELLMLIIAQAPVA